MTKLEYIEIRQVNLLVFDKLVRETYGRDYSFQQQDGCQPRGTFDFRVPDNYPYDYENDTLDDDNRMGVSFKAWLARDPDDGDEYFWQRYFYPHIEMVVSDLNKRGLIDDCDYTIVIDW